jgi:hypothetical protein
MEQSTEIRITDQGPVLGHGWMQVISVVLLVFGAIFAFAAWDSGDSSGAAELRRLALIVLGVGAIPFTITIIQVVRLFRAIGRAELILPHHYLPLGFRGNLTYRRPLRRGARVEQIEARLQCQESVVKGSGKHKSVRRAIVYDEPITPVAVPSLDELRLQMPLRIPETGPASFDMAEATITWWVRLRLRMQGCPNTRSSFELDIWPGVEK